MSMNDAFWKPQPKKLPIYEALYTMNRAFEATLLCLDRLDQLGMLRLESLNTFKTALEHTRAEANQELVETLQDYEQEESARFDAMEREWQKRVKDPDDVLFAAEDRKQEIRKQINELQKALGPETTERKPGKKQR